MSKFETAIILVNYNGTADTLECIESLLLHLKNEFHIVVVDNQSKEDSYLALAKGLEKLNSRKVSLIRTKTNGGFAFGNNQGIKYAREKFKSKYYWLLNNDTIIKENILDSLILFYQSKKSVGILGAKLKMYEKPKLIQAIGGTFKKYQAKVVQIGFNQVDQDQFGDSAIRVDFVVGASMFVSHNFIEEVGYMSEEYFLYFEELDWAIRGSLKGFDTYTLPHLEVYHKQGKSTGNKAGVSLALEPMYYQFRNLTLIYKKYFSSLTLISIVRVFIRAFKYTLQYKKPFHKIALKAVLNKPFN
ncbi:MAG: glycosyltransferase family 2 protein [Vicingaceae bacterium]